MRNPPTVSGGGDAAPFSAADDIAIAADACPNGWPASAIIAATPNPVSTVDNSCTSRLAFTFDDGPSYYRPQTLAVFCAKQAPATFFNLAARSVANPQMLAFTLAEGHKIALHGYEHPRLTNLSVNGLRFQIEGAANLMPGVIPVLRAPFGGVNASVNEQVAAMGFAPDGTQAAGTTDFDPVRTSAQIRDAIVAALRPGRGIVLHDGPIDTPAGQATVDAVPMIIDEARARGYCFGVVDDAGRVVAGRYTNSGQPIPQITNAMPYSPLAYPGTPPSPWRLVAQRLRVDATHSPAILLRGSTGSLTLTVSNPTTDTPSDDNPTVITQAIPTGLTATSASGEGWTCTGTTTITCTRMTVLAPGAKLPAITIAVNVAATAPATIATAPRVTGRGGNVWVHNGADLISTATPVPGDVGGTVPATLALTLGAPATFGVFTPGLAKEYTASTTANVISTAGDAALSVTGANLVNGAFSLAAPVRVGANGNAPAPLPATLLTYARPVANDAVAIAFAQAISATEPLRTGTYSTTLVFTLETTTP